MNNDTKWIIESTIAPLERTIKRLWILCILLIVILLGTNIGWLIYENQWQYVDTTHIEQDVEQEVDGDGGTNTFIGGNNGNETDSTSNSSKN